MARRLWSCRRISSDDVEARMEEKDCHRGILIFLIRGDCGSGVRYDEVELPTVIWSVDEEMICGASVVDEHLAEFASPRIVHLHSE
jgi:hypothetical protein